MVLGEDEDIDPGVRQDFRDSGLAHLLAVSGQNVVLLAALALPLLALAGLGARARLLGLLLLTALYVPLAGAGPALQRAGVMGAAGIAATAASRPGSGAYALLLAAAATLAANPQSRGRSGLAAFVRGGRRDHRARAAAPARNGRGAGGASPGPTAPPPRGRAREAASRAAVDGIAMSVAATLATAPLLALHFGRVPLAGLPANLLALPAVAPVMWLGMAKAAVGQLAGLGTAGGAARGRGRLAPRMGGARAARLPVVGGPGVRRRSRGRRHPAAALPGHVGLWPTRLLLAGWAADRTPGSARAGPGAGGGGAWRR